MLSVASVDTNYNFTRIPFLCCKHFLSHPLMCFGFFFSVELLLLFLCLLPLQVHFFFLPLAIFGVAGCSNMLCHCLGCGNRCATSQKRQVIDSENPSPDGAIHRDLGSRWSGCCTSLSQSRNRSSTSRVRVVGR